MIDTLKRAMEACAAGKLGERELIAISLAVNAHVRNQIEDPKGRALYAAFAASADKKMLDRIAELDASKA